MELNFKWKPQTGKYQCGVDCYLGRVKVGSAEYAMTSEIDKPPKYRACITLPGMRMKADTVFHLTVQDAKDRVERAVRTWLEWLIAEVEE